MPKIERKRTIIRAILLLTGLLSLSWGATIPCESLSTLTLPQTRITVPQSVTAGAFQPLKHPWQGPGVTKRAIPDHRFGFGLKAEDKASLLVFLRSL